MPHHVLTQIPDDLLWTGARGQARRFRRASELASWLKDHGATATFAELEHERNRRRAEYLAALEQRDLTKPSKSARRRIQTEERNR